MTRIRELSADALQYLDEWVAKDPVHRHVRLIINMASEGGYGVQLVDCRDKGTPEMHSHNVLFYAVVEALKGRD